MSETMGNFAAALPTLVTLTGENETLGRAKHKRHKFTWKGFQKIARPWEKAALFTVAPAASAAWITADVIKARRKKAEEAKKRRRHAQAIRAAATITAAKTATPAPGAAPSIFSPAAAPITPATWAPAAIQKARSIRQARNEEEETQDETPREEEQQEEAQHEEAQHEEAQHEEAQHEEAQHEEAQHEETAQGESFEGNYSDYLVGDTPRTARALVPVFPAPTQIRNIAAPETLPQKVVSYVKKHPAQVSLIAAGGIVGTFLIISMMKNKHKKARR